MCTAFLILALVIGEPPVKKESAKPAALPVVTVPANLPLPMAGPGASCVVTPGMTSRGRDFAAWVRSKTPHPFKMVRSRLLRMFP